MMPDRVGTARVELGRVTVCKGVAGGTCENGSISEITISGTLFFVALRRRCGHFLAGGSSRIACIGGTGDSGWTAKEVVESIAARIDIISESRAVAEAVNLTRWSLRFRLFLGTMSGVFPDLEACVELT